MEFHTATPVFAFISGAALAVIQFRRIIKGELAPWGIKSFRDASKIKIDKFDKYMLTISVLAFLGMLVLIVQAVG